VLLGYGKGIDNLYLKNGQVSQTKLNEVLQTSYAIVLRPGWKRHLK
jgi:hypothetical protein